MSFLSCPQPWTREPGALSAINQATPFESMSFSTEGPLSLAAIALSAGPGQTRIGTRPLSIIAFSRVRMPRATSVASMCRPTFGSLGEQPYHSAILNRSPRTVFRTRPSG